MGIFDSLKGNKVITPEDRRKKTVEQLKKQGIAYNPHLPLLESSGDVKLKSPEEIKKRALGCMMCVQLACSINNGEDYGEALAFVLQKFVEWNISIDDLLPKERLLIQNKYTKNGCTDEFARQDLADIVWTYEVYWSLAWALDLIADKELANAETICDTEKAMMTSAYVQPSSRLRNVEKILDMLDLFYCYHWACVEKQIRPETETGKLNPEVVMERRRGLEWLICEEKDWNDISLDT